MFKIHLPPKSIVLLPYAFILIGIVLFIINMVTVLGLLRTFLKDETVDKTKLFIDQEKVEKAIIMLDEETIPN